MMITTPDRRFFVTGLAGLLASGVLGIRRGRAADSKVLIAAIEEDPPLLNSAMSSTTSTYEGCTAAYNALVWMDVDGGLHPDLAESWEISPDGKTYTFRLRKGVLWHDGQPFTSADVKYSLGELTAKYQPVGKGAYKFLAGFDTPDDYTVAIRMTQPYSPFLNIPYAIGPILPRHLWEGTDALKNPHNQSPIGTGPFKFVESVPGDRIRFVKNPNYHIPGQPAFDEFVIRIIPDAAARVAAFENHEVDMLFSTAVPSTEIARLSKMPKVELKFSPIGGSAWLGNINSRSAPYGDVRVRQAMAHAIDRKFIRDNVLPGISENMVGPLWPGSPLYNKSLKDYAFDPALANQMLDDAGYKKRADGTRFDFRLMWTANDIRVTKMADVMAQNLLAVGIKTIPTPLERTAVIQKGYINGQFDMIIASFALGPDPDAGAERFYNSSNILPLPNVNNSAYSNPEVDKLFDEQRLQVDLASRKAIYDKIQELIWADIPVFPICAYNAPSIVHGDYVSNAFTTYNNIIDNMAAAKPTV